MAVQGSQKYRVFDSDQLRQLVARGIPERYVFPHVTYTLPKCGPNAAKLAKSMVPTTVFAYRLITLHACGSVADRFPGGLFYDDDLIWHRQQYGRPGHIAFATFVQAGNDIYGLNYVSDIVQRQSRAPCHRTQIEARFGGWPTLLLHSVLNFAVENGIRKFYSPASELILQNADRNRSVHPELFQRVYDAAVSKLFDVERRGDWWVIDVMRNRDRIVCPRYGTESRPSRRLVCVTHDIEGGHGHRDIDLDFASRADESADRNVDAMLAIEGSKGVRATYSVVGLMLEEFRDRIVRNGHNCAFHSYDHSLGDDYAQLTNCRLLDQRIRGYRAPRSVVGTELSNGLLWRFDFDWLASSANSLRLKAPALRDNVIYIPVILDDFPLYRDRGALSYDEWERNLLDVARQCEFIAIGLHDCYGDHWLPAYGSLLDRLGELGEFATLDEVANEVFLDHSL